MTERPHERFVAQFTRKRGRKYILDGFDAEFYLIFDFEEAEGCKPDTCDVLIQGLPEDERRLVCVLANCRQSHVLRFLFALGIDRFSESVRSVVYPANSIIRTMDDRAI